MQKMIKEVNIVQQPFSVIVPINYKVTLSVGAESVRADSVLKYQWFSGEENEIHGATKANLTVKAQKTQVYVCRVNDQFCNCTFSDWVKVKVLNIDRPALPVAWQGEPYIIVQPKSQTVTQGGKLSLHCYAFGIPTPHFQWYRNGQQLQGSNSDMLQLECSSADHGGTFLCSLSNVLEEIWTDPAEVCIVPTEERPSPTPTATDKVALLIGNLNYSHHPYLMAPTMDVHELGNLLQQLGFRVVSLLDLTRDEMLAAIDKFIQLLDKGVYALFYYAGHGYEHSGRNYLVAIDAPQPYQKENCVCVQKVMGSMQQKHTALSVILLDTCRKWYNQDHLVSQIMPLEPRGNTVYGYGTCEDAEAFEVQDGGKSTGIFTKYLNKHILKPQKVTHVLEQVSEDLGRDPLVTGKQAVEIKHTLKEPRSLADPMRAAGHTRELRQRDACWRQANELPRQKVIPFTCGAKVNVSFSALFSNVMVVFAKVKTTGPTAQDCTIVLRSIPAMEDIFSGPGGSDEMDSLLLNSSDNPDSSIRLCGLQKLQGSLVIKVDLHYTHTDSKLRLRESHQLDIGMPLVASCKLYKRKHTEAVKRTESAPAQSLNVSNLKQPLQDQTLGRPFTRKAVCTAKVTASRSNQPEENDENEHQYFTC